MPVPHLNDVDGWERACFGASAQAEAQQLGPADGAEMTQLTHGICSKLMALSQVCAWQLLPCCVHAVLAAGLLSVAGHGRACQWH